MNISHLLDGYLRLFGEESGLDFQLIARAEWMAPHGFEHGISISINGMEHAMVSFTAFPNEQYLYMTFIRIYQKRTECLWFGF